MHLLITSVGDATSDLLCERLAGRVLRLNWERCHEYEMQIDATGFRIADAYDRAVTDSNLGNVIWRKPLNEIDVEAGEAWYRFQEFKYAVQSIVSLVRRQNPRKLPIDPQRNTLADKLQQLRVASRHLRVPQWLLTSTPSNIVFSGDAWVVKSLTGQPIPGTGDPATVIYTVAVDPAQLADGFPWLLQRKIDAAFDLTVVYVDGGQFAFVLDRSQFCGLDWRRSIGSKHVDYGWKRVNLPVDLRASLSGIMSDLGLRFGRFDLLTNSRHCDDHWCLEVNPNGQWAWLDPALNNGLFEAVVEFLTSE